MSLFRKRINGTYLLDKREFSSHLKNILGFSPGNLELYEIAFIHRSATFVLQNGTAKASIAKAEKPLVKITALKGIFKIKNMPDGIYTVTIEKTGFKTITVTVNIANGDLTVLEVQLEKN